MKTVFLLHGAIGASAQLEALRDHLSAEFDVVCPDFAGHGSAPMTNEPFSIDLFAKQVAELVHERQLERISIVGYSMGGYVGMYIAKKNPALVEGIVTLGTKFYWDRNTSAREVLMLDPEKIAAKIPAFAQALGERHKNDWKNVLSRTAEMMIAMGTNSPLKMDDFSAMDLPVMLLLGDRDKMVTLEETVAVYKALPNARLGVLPNTPHAIEQVAPEIPARLINEFLK